MGGSDEEMNKKFCPLINGECREDCRFYLKDSILECVLRYFFGEAMIWSRGFKEFLFFLNQHTDEIYKVLKKLAETQ